MSDSHSKTSFIIRFAHFWVLTFEFAIVFVNYSYRICGKPIKNIQLPNFIDKFVVCNVILILKIPGLF